MARKGKIFKMVNSEVEIEALKEATEIDNSASLIDLLDIFLFLYRQLNTKKKLQSKICNVRLFWQQVNGCTTHIIIKPLSKEQEAFEKFYNAIKEHRIEDASFFIWRRSYKEGTRKISFAEAWKASQRDSDGEKAVVIPIESKNNVFAKALEEQSHLSISMWVPYENSEAGILKIQSDGYPAEMDWKGAHKIYIEWTEPKINPNISTNTVSSSADPNVSTGPSIEEILNKFPNEKIDSILKTLRSTLKNEAPDLYRQLDLLSSYRSSPILSKDEQLSILSIALMET